MNEPNCVWRPEWQGYFCPPFPESYFQVQIYDLTGKPNDTAVDGITYPTDPLRPIYANFILMSIPIFKASFDNFSRQHLKNIS